MDETKKKLICLQVKAHHHHPCLYTQNFFRHFRRKSNNIFMHECTSQLHTHTNVARRVFSAACSLQFALLIADIYANKAVHSDSEQSKEKTKSNGFQ